MSALSLSIEKCALVFAMGDGLGGPTAIPGTGALGIVCGLNEDNDGWQMIISTD
jgi:hypothetical protein